MKKWPMVTSLRWTELANTLRSEASEVFKINVKYANAWLRVNLYSATTGPEDYQVLNLKLSMPSNDWKGVRLPWGVAKHPERWGDEGDWHSKRKKMSRSGTWPDRAKEQFARGDTGDGEVIQLTITTVYEVLQRDPRDWEWCIMDSNYAHAQWSVASMILGLNCGNDAIPELMHECGMLDVPLYEWIDAFKEWTNSMRRVCAVWEDTEIEQHEWMGIRKMLDCSDRVREDADWAKEVRRRTGELPGLVGLKSNGMLQPAEWMRVWDRNAVRVTEEAISSMNDSIELENTTDWMSARWAHMPTGSSSIRQIIDSAKSSDRRLKSGARPSKKTTSEAMPSWLLAFIIMFVEPMAFIRTSTKEEPQRKLRALYAICCISALVSSFASVHIEKFITAEGIRAKQSPADVLEWVQAGVATRDMEQWLSVDYSDWNWQIMQIMLIALNLRLAQAWTKCYTRDPKVAAQKRAAAMWVASSHTKMFVDMPIIGEMRLLATLCSGHRDTARDNCTVHGINKSSIVEMAEKFDSKAKPSFMFITGDDEDGRFNDMFAAASYLLTTLLCCFDLNAAKQLGGRWTHEFLQRMARANDTPTMPLWAALAQYSSGNWYKDVTIWFDTSVQACSDNAYEMHRRGMPLVYARRLAASTLNAMMRIPHGDGTGYEKLEWWSFRQGGTVHPLWAGTSGPSVAGPKTPSECRPRVPQDMKKASWDWILSRKRRMNLQIPEEKEEMLVSRCVEKSYAKLFESVRGETQRELARTMWPRRRNEPDYSAMHVMHHKPMKSRDVLYMLLGTQPDRRPTTLEEVLMRMGLDIDIVEAAGGLMAVYRHMPPQHQAKYENPITTVQLPVEIMHVDQALIANASNVIGIKLPPIEEPDVGRMTRVAKRIASQGPMGSLSKFVPSTISVVLAPNAAGKTTWAHEREGRLDMDKAISSQGMKKVLQWTAKFAKGRYSPAAAAAVEREIMRVGADSIATQWAPASWIGPPSKRGMRYDIQVWILPEETLQRRMYERGWTQEKMERRMQRWQQALEQLKEMPKWLTEEEYKNIEYKHIVQ